MNRKMILVRTAPRESPISQLRPVKHKSQSIFEKEEYGVDSPRITVPAPVMRDVSCAS